MIRRALDAFRRKREYFRPVGQLLYRKLDPKGVIVRRVDEGDIGLLESFLCHGDYLKHRERLHAQNTNSAEYLIAWHVVPMGHVLIMWEGSEDGPLAHRKDREPLIEDLYVHPAAQRKGIGKMLIDEAETIILQKGYDSVGVNVMVNNPAVKTMYKERGFQDTDLGVFETRQIFRDDKGCEKLWSAKVCYLVKKLRVVSENEN